MKNKYVTDKNSLDTRWLGYHKEIKDFLSNYAVLSDLEKEKNVKVVYSSPSNAFVKHITPLINGQTEKPVLTYVLESEEMIDNVGPFMNPVSFYFTESRTKAEMKHPIIKELNYTCNLFTKTMTQADAILTRLEMECNTFRPYIIKVNNKTSDIYLSEIKNNTNINVGAGENRLIFYSFNIKVPRAYISPVEVTNNIPIVDEVKTYIGIEQEQEQV